MLNPFFISTVHLGWTVSTSGDRQQYCHRYFSPTHFTATSTELYCFTNAFVGDGGASIKVGDGAGEADDFDLGAVAAVFVYGVFLEVLLLCFC